MTFINFQIQWHITEKCPNQCKHCYMFDEEYKRRIENEKNYMELRVILDKLKEFEEKYNIFFPRIVLTGGDPMAHSDCMRLIQEIKARGKDCMLLGIPERVTDEMIIELMQKGVSRYQVSCTSQQKLDTNFTFFFSKYPTTVQCYASFVSLLVADWIVSGASRLSSLLVHCLCGFGLDNRSSSDIIEARRPSGINLY